MQIINESDKIRILKNDYECSIKFLVSQLLLFEKKYQTLENSIVKNLGLYVIGTERNDSEELIINFGADVVDKEILVNLDSF